MALCARNGSPLVCCGLGLVISLPWGGGARKSSAAHRYTIVTEAGEQKTSIGFTGTGPVCCSWRPCARRLSGKATANYANGDIYEGLFENGVRHGQGTYTCARDVPEATTEMTFACTEREVLEGRRFYRDLRQQPEDWFGKTRVR